MLYDLAMVDGWSDLSDLFCNTPVRASSTFSEGTFNDPVAIIYLCGRLAGHDGDCDPIPPVEDVM